MHPYVIEQLVAERQQALRQLARADAGARAARRHAGHPRDSAWRRAMGRALLAGAVAVGVPRPERPAARCRATTALGLEPGC